MRFPCRYLADLDFRYSNRVRLGVDDVERTEHAVKRAVGDRTAPG